LLAESDFITIHTPLLPETRHLFTLETFHKMKPTACLVNTARGPIIKETDLVIALREKIIAGAALDVFEHEPRLSPGLAAMKERLIVTPHVGSATGETRRQMCMLAVENILAAYAGVRPPTLLNPAVWPLNWEQIQS
jgi:glyoxylate reductase